MRRRLLARLALTMSPAVLATAVFVAPASAKPYSSPRVQKEPVVAGSTVKAGGKRAETATPFTIAAPKWPAATDLPVKVDAPGVRVEALDRAATKAAGVDGLLLRVSAPARLTVDYRGFRGAYGGDWASRLRLYQLPQCAGCAPVPVKSTNDTVAGTVSGAVDGAALVAVAAAPAGSNGDFQATSLSPSATWGAGGNTGGFTWSYSLAMPPPVGGAAPKVALSYSSSSVDGRMAAANNQPSWIGEGFEWHPGSIERRYRSCSDDMDSGANNTQKTGDQCWETDNASLSLGGHAGELLKDPTNANRWHLRNDDGTFIERRTGGPNSDNNGEWWLVRTTDGTKYWFGGRSGSNAALTVPVAGNHSGEQCHASAFADSFCTQAYRWQLDYVEDAFGNTTSYTYAKDTNKYGRNGKAEDDTVYDRDGYLTKIEYGTHTSGTGTAPMRVLFGTADRCLSNCASHDAQHWPDVPWDRECTATTTACAWNQLSPTFWSTRRLASVKTQVWTGSSYRDVDSWTFTHSFPNPSDSTTAALWLSKITRVGMPDVTFTGVVMPNRVDTLNDQFPAMNRYRLKTVTSETGGKTEVTYSGPDCVRGTRVPDKDNLHLNTLRCYPVKWTPDGYAAPIHDYFHKYLVTDVVEADAFGSSSRVLTHYDYVGSPAWHYTDDDGFLKKENKTWSVWRGYPTVRETKGDAGEQTRQERHYFRGMHGDKLPSGTRGVTLPAIAIGGVPAVNDEDAFAGMVRESIVYNGPGGAEVSATASVPWQSAPTASRTINGQTVHARRIGQLSTHTRTTLDAGRGHRTTSSANTFDAYGMVSTVEDRGDDAVTGDEKCTLTTYVRNTASWIVDRVAQSRSYAVNCARAAQGGLTEADILADTRTYYDGLAWNTTPAKGAPTKVEELATLSGYAVVKRSAYDKHGRVVESWDARDAKTATSYTPATGGPVTATATTNALGWTTSSTLDPGRGVPLKVTDANERVTELAYDSLGRVTAVWKPGRDRASATANVTFEYLVRNNAPTAVVTRQLTATGAYVSSYQLFDGLLRNRQSQVADMAGGSGAVVTDMFYDSAGRPVKSHNGYLTAVAPSGDLFVPSGTIPSVTVTEYDGAGRITAAVSKVDAPPASPGGVEKWRTTTVYGGDRTDAIEPTGGISRSTVTDAAGRTTELRSHRGDGTHERTAYTYNRKGQLTQLTDAAGISWTYEYDLRGRQIRVSDPDKGVSETTYNGAGDVESTTDSRGITLAHTYDILGRKTTTREGSITGDKRAEWVFDTVPGALGRQAKSIRYDGTSQYVQEVTGYTVEYQPTGTRYTVPGFGTYNFVFTYSAHDGSPLTVRLPGAGDLGQETLTFGYNALGSPDTLSTSLGGTLVASPGSGRPATEYTSYGELAAVHMRHTGQQVDVTRGYEHGTRRLLQIKTSRTTAPADVADMRYGYDAAGNVTKISDLVSADHQCFTTDHLRRLTEAWTPGNGDCAPEPSAALLGGPAPYWHSFAYDAIGNRTRLVEHTGGADDRVTTYAVQPGTHRLTGTSTGDDASAYTYDASGNTLTRPTAAAGTQTLTWDAEGHLATSTDTAGTTSFQYDADGNRLLRKDPQGSTLYLPGQEIRVLKSGTVSCVRYYSHAGMSLATRTSAGVTWLSGDHHGTARITVADQGQQVAVNRETPFGAARAGSGSWPSTMDKGFVGGTRDNTGLTHLGAREYDPAIGRFISVDPVLDEGDTQQLHGYSYANNAPITASDPTGLWPDWLDEAAQDVADGISDVGAAVQDGIETVGDAIATGASAAADKISDVASVAGDAIAFSAATWWNSVTEGASMVGGWLYDNSDIIASVLGGLAIGAAGLGMPALAAAFGTGAWVFGLVATIKSCREGKTADCTFGIITAVIFPLSLLRALPRFSRFMGRADIGSWIVSTTILVRDKVLIPFLDWLSGDDATFNPPRQAGGRTRHSESGVASVASGGMSARSVGGMTKRAGGLTGKASGGTGGRVYPRKPLKPKGICGVPVRGTHSAGGMAKFHKRHGV